MLVWILIGNAFNPNPTFFESSEGREPSSRGQWDSALRAPRKPPGVILRQPGPARDLYAHVPTPSGLTVLADQ
jgi:hypothetical protein